MDSVWVLGEGGGGGGVAVVLSVLSVFWLSVFLQGSALFPAWLRS